eukprot:jgi/Mesvir1/18353/Mv14249-RA.2
MMVRDMERSPWRNARLWLMLCSIATFFFLLTTQPSSHIIDGSSQVPESGNAARLELYESMAREFEQFGFESREMEKARDMFVFPREGALSAGEKANDSVRPITYHVKFPGVRLVVAPLACAAHPSSRSLGHLLSAMAFSVSSLLPRGTPYFRQPCSTYHSTLFHLSHPNDLRPAGGPDTALLLKERAAVQQLLARMAPLVLQVERLVMTRSGTLLVVFTDATPGMAPSAREGAGAHHPGSRDAPGAIVGVDRLKQEFWGRFPEAPPKQAGASVLIHTTILRVFSGEGAI